jgi:hypothetical protein
MDPDAATIHTFKQSLLQPGIAMIAPVPATVQSPKDASGTKRRGLMLIPSKGVSCMTAWGTRLGKQGVDVKSARAAFYLRSRHFFGGERDRPQIGKISRDLKKSMHLGAFRPF